MYVTDNNLKEQETNSLDDLRNNDFYCEKCYDMFNYFISKCLTLSPRAAKFEKLYSKYKKDCKHYKSKYETLEFDYEEMKAQKEDLEERYNLLLRTLTKKSQPQEPDDQSLTALFSFQELSDLIVEETLTTSVKQTEQIHENNQLVAYDSTTSIKLDMHFLTEQIIGKTTINCQLILDFFGKTINQVMKESNKRFLKIKNEEPNQEIENLNNSIKKAQIEIDQLKQKLTNEIEYQSKLKSENTNLKEKLNNLETISQQFIEENNENLVVEREKLAQAHSELDELRKAHYQLQQHNNTLTKKLNECDELFRLEFESLKLNYTATESDLQNKLTVFLEKLTTTESKLKLTQIDVDEMQKEISTLRADLIQSEDENKKLSFEYEQKNEAYLAELRQKSIWFELKYKDEFAQNIQTTEAYELKIKNLIKTNQVEISSQSNDYESKLNSLFREKEQTAREVLDLQRKLCLTLTEKDKILSESMQILKQHETVLAQQKEIQSKLEHQISELRQEINIQQLKPKPSTVLNEKVIELEILLEEKRHHLDEIASFKADIDKLNQQLKADKEHEKLSKEKQQLYQQKLKKQATEIKQLNEKLKDQQETNDFLTNQINNLNKQVFDLENEKENETNQKFVNKRLLVASLVEDGSDLNSSKYLAPVNQNLQRVLDMSGVKTPMKSTSGIASPSSATSSNLDTPSTERKKSAQCAQQ